MSVQNSKTYTTDHVRAVTIGQPVEPARPLKHRGAAPQPLAAPLGKAIYLRVAGNAFRISRATFAADRLHIAALLQGLERLDWQPAGLAPFLDHGPHVGPEC